MKYVYLYNSKVYHYIKNTTSSIDDICETVCNMLWWENAKKLRYRLCVIDNPPKHLKECKRCKQLYENKFINSI